MGEMSLGGRARPVTQEDLARYARMQATQEQHQVPLLQSADQPHTHVYFVLLDGTGQDMSNPRQRPSNIGRLAKELMTSQRSSHMSPGVGYVEGIGTQSEPVARLLDGTLAFTWDDKIKRAYRDLGHRAKVWRESDPDAEVAIAAVGYSRGAVLVPGLLRLVDRYGIADPDDLKFGRDRHGNITVISSKPPLVAPGQVPQIVGLFDPVGTNLPAHYDARLNPRVLSAFSILATDEARTLFPHHAIIDPGLSADRRMFNASGAGGHANVGGGNADPLLETMAYNAMVDYLNTAFETPVLRTLPLPATLTQGTAQQVGGVTAGFGLRVDRDGERNLRDTLADCRIVDPCRDAEPLDTAFAARFEWRTVRPAWQVPALAPLARAEGMHISPDQPAHPDHARLERIREGVRVADAGVGKPWDDASERLSRNLLAASKDGGDIANTIPDGTAALARIDHVVLGTDARYLFAVQGGMHEPAHRFVGVLVEKAVLTPLDQSDLRLQQANARIAEVQAEGQASSQTLEPVQARTVSVPAR